MNSYDLFFEKYVENANFRNKVIITVLYENFY